MEKASRVSRVMEVFHLKEAMSTHFLAYEAILSNANNVARVNAARHAIKQVGGKLSVAPLQTQGMILVTLTLPDTYTPDRFLPGLPFYPSATR